MDIHSKLIDVVIEPSLSFADIMMRVAVVMVLVVAGFVMLHTGIGVFLTIWFFASVCVISWLAMNVVAYVGGIRQNWQMFTPGPPKRDAWYVVPAKLKYGQEVDG